MERLKSHIGPNTNKLTNQFKIPISETSFIYMLKTYTESEITRYALQVRPVNSTPFMAYSFTYAIGKWFKLDVYDLVVSSPLIITMDTIYQHKKFVRRTWLFTVWFLFYFLFFETEGWLANTKAQEAVDHLASFPSSGEDISQPGYEPPTSSLRFGYLSTIIW